MIKELDFRIDNRYLLFFDVETSNKYFIQKPNQNIEDAKIITLEEYENYKLLNEKAAQIKHVIGSYMITKMVCVMDEEGGGVCIILDDEFCETEVYEDITDNWNIEIVYADTLEELIENYWQTIKNYIREYGDLRIFAHNIGFDIKQIDFFNQIKNIEGREMLREGKSDKIQSCCLSKPFFLKLRYNDMFTISFEDSYNFFSTSLKKLGKDIGVKKLDFNFDGTDLIINDLCVKYCINDTYIIKKAICDFRDFLHDKELGTMGITTSSTALNVWRTSFLEIPINNSYNKAIQPYDKDYIVNIERKSYYGGRNECYKIGNFENIYYHDMTSIYPYVMRENKFPIKFQDYLIDRKLPISYIDELLSNKDNYYIFKCNIKTDRPNVPVRRDRLLFVKGEIETYLHLPEFLYYYNAGEVTKVTEVLIYKADDIFSNYVTFFEKMKNDNDDNPTKRYQAKLLQNGLYGKLAEHFRDSLLFDNYIPKIGSNILIDKNDCIIGRRDDFGYFGYHTIEDKNKNARTAFPSIAGAVTSYARIELLKMMEIVGRENVLYCDTDSIMSIVPLDEKYIHPLKYGLWKNEAIKIHGKEKINVIIKGCKNYILHNGNEVLEIKSKGIKKDSKEVFDDIYSTNKWWTVKTSKVKKETLFTLKHTIIMHEIKSNTLEYKKGHVIGKGNKNVSLYLDGVKKTFKYNVRDIKPYLYNELTLLDKEV